MEEIYKHQIYKPIYDAFYVMYQYVECVDIKAEQTNKIQVKGGSRKYRGGVPKFLYKLCVCGITFKPTKVAPIPGPRVVTPPAEIQFTCMQQLSLEESTRVSEAQIKEMVLPNIVEIHNNSLKVQSASAKSTVIPEKQELSFWSQLKMLEREIFIQIMLLIQKEEVKEANKAKLNAALEKRNERITDFRSFMLLIVSTFKDDTQLMADIMSRLITLLPVEITEKILSAIKPDNPNIKSPLALTLDRFSSYFWYKRTSNFKSLFELYMHVIGPNRKEQFTPMDNPTINRLRELLNSHDHKNDKERLIRKITAMAAPIVLDYGATYFNHRNCICFHLPNNQKHRLIIKYTKVFTSNKNAYMIDLYTSNPPITIHYDVLEVEYSPVNNDQKYFIHNGQAVRKVHYSVVNKHSQPELSTIDKLGNLIRVALCEIDPSNESNYDMYYTYDTSGLKEEFKYVQGPGDVSVQAFIKESSTKFLQELESTGEFTLDNEIWDSDSEYIEQQKDNRDGFEFDQPNDPNESDESDYSDESDESHESHEPHELDESDIFDKFYENKLADISKEENEGEIQNIVETIARGMVRLRLLHGFHYQFKLKKNYFHPALESMLNDDIRIRIKQCVFNIMRCYKGTGAVIEQPFDINGNPALNYEDVIKILFPKFTNNSLAGGAHGKISKATLRNKTRVEILKLGKELGLRGISSLKKDEIILRITRQQRKKK